MRTKNSIFWWFKIKRKPVVAKTTHKNIKDEIKQTKDSSTNEKENTIMSPIPDIISLEQKETERILPPKKNERNTLIKPSKKIGMENIVETKKQDVDKKLKLDDNKSSKKTKQKTLSNDTTIKVDTLDEIEKMIKTNYYEIQNIKYDLEVLEKKAQDENAKEEVEKLIEELNKLIKKFEEIKKDFYQKNFSELYLHTNNDNYIGYLIEEYKTSLIVNNDKENPILQIKQIEEYIALINCIIDIETKKDILAKKVTDKKETLEIKEDEFDALKDKVIDTEKTSKYIESFNNEFNHIINNIQDKIAKADTITKNVEYKTEIYINYSKLLTSTLLLAASPIIPFSKKGNILKTGLIIAAVTGMASAIKTRTYENKTITKINFINYEKEIISGINSISSMDSLINNAIIDISFLKKEFKQEFEEYKDSLNEYSELLSKLDSIEKDLLVRQKLNKEYNKKLENALEQNNIKVKRLEEEHFN